MTAVPGIRVQVVIDAAPATVWASVSDISSHVQWMDDAVAIRFQTDQRAGVGTRFDCETRVGPLRTTDTMEVTEWVPERAIAIRHQGLVKGEGRFTLRGLGSGTEFTWEERLSFPVWLARPVLIRVWRKNLRNLKRLIERS